MRTLSLVLLSSIAFAAEPAADAVTVAVPASDKDRRWVLVEFDAKGKELPGGDVVDEKGSAQPGQPTAKGLAWLVPGIPAGQKLKFEIRKVQGSVPAPALRWSESGSGVTALKLGDKEITRYNTGAAAEKQ